MGRGPLGELRSFGISCEILKKTLLFLGNTGPYQDAQLGSRAHADICGPSCPLGWLLSCLMNNLRIWTQQP